MAVRRSFALLVMAGACALLTSCGDSTGAPQSAAVPAEVQPACGRPGTVVKLVEVPVTIKHADCDLTGVVLEHGGAGVTVPTSGNVTAQTDGRKGSSSLTVLVAAGSKDVTVRR